MRFPVGTLLAVSLLLAACSYGSGGGSPSACAKAAEERLQVTSDLALGATAHALEAIEEANAQCPEGRRESRGDEVKLLAELARCPEALALAAEIEADADHGDGAWLSAAVARAHCQREAAAPPRIEDAIAAIEFANGTGEAKQARRMADRALAIARANNVPIDADCTHWSYLKTWIAGYLAGLDAIVVVDDEHALALRATDGRELRNFYGHRGRITHVATSKEGRLLITASDGDVILWSIDRALPLLRVAGHGPVALSDDGSRYAWVDSAGVHIAPTAGGADKTLPIVTPIDTLTLLRDGVALSTDGKVSVRADDGKVRFEVAHAPVLTIVPQQGDALLLGRTQQSGFIDIVERGRVHSLVGPGVHVRAIDPDGTQYVTSHPAPRAGTTLYDRATSGWRTTVYDRATNREVDLVEPVQEGRLEFCGGRLFEIDENGDVVVRNLATGARMPVLAAMSHEFGTVSIPDDGTAILINLTTYSREGSTTKSFVWSSTGPLELRERHGFYFGGNPDIAFAQYRSVVEAWSARSGAPLTRMTFDGQLLGSPHLSPSGRFVAINVGGSVVRVDLERELPNAHAEGLPRGFDEAGHIVVEHGEAFELLDPITLSVVGMERTWYDGRHGRPPCADAQARECIAETRIVDAATNWERHDSFAYVDADGRRTPFEEYGDELPNGLLMPRDARYAMSYFRDGTIFFYSPRGGDAVAFRPFADGTGGYLRTKEGELELFGAAESRAVCRIGAFSLPIATCPALVTTGLLRDRLRSGDP